jgi:hypothetical protein
LIADLVPDRAFADLAVPLAVPALDIRSGRIEIHMGSCIDRCERLDLGLEALFRIQRIAECRRNGIELAGADLVVRPELGARHGSDFSDVEETIEMGEAAARAALPELRALVASPKP